MEWTANWQSQLAWQNTAGVLQNDGIVDISPPLIP
jgi:hypothetical protein